MRRKRLAGGWLVAAALLAPLASAYAADAIRLLTGPQASSQYRMGAELARRLGPATGAAIAAEPTAGPGEILQRLRDESGHDGLNLAVMQADVAQLYLLAAQGGSPEAAAWLAPLRVVAPLHVEELHFIVRADSRFESLQDIRDARINVGPAAGGTALSVATLYRLLFDTAPPPGNLGRLADEEALAKLLTDRSVDVVALLADQPAPLLANMKPEARRFIRLLKFDRTHPTAAVVSRVYGGSVLRATSYPKLLDNDVPALAVRLYLAAYDGERQDAQGLRRFATAYCREMPQLRAVGHRKWREIAPGLPALAPGWHYSETSTPELARCLGLADNETPDTCLPVEHALGLCHAVVTIAPAAAPQ